MTSIFINDHIYDFDLEEALVELSDQRREVALKYKHELGQRTCAAAYLLLCEGLRKVYGITEKPLFEYGEHGKPSIVGHPDIHFNLSHCKEAAICAIGDHPVGVDVESVRRYDETLARHVMNDQEMERIMQAERPEVMFTRLWTMKEAVVKRSGRGIADDIKHVLENESGVITVESPDLRYIYSIAGFALDGK
ncbi:MAG: 4'-phosphopantetheinyl transferase superfamily protein [Prevotella sp.]|nr:4'-phosphopantetheinyl transferase superfamily protein [Prevotella sp.]